MTVPTEPLPTNRVAYDKQKEIIKAFAIASSGGKVASNKAVAEMVGIHDSAVRFAAEFFSSIGLLQEVSGGFRVAKEVSDYHLADGIRQPNAFYRIAPLFQKTWFAKALLPKLQMKSLSESDALATLHFASSTDKEYRGRIKMLLRYMEDAGLIKSDGENISLLQSQASQTEGDEPRPPMLKVTESNLVNSQPMKRSTDYAGGVQLNFSITVDYAELSTWSPDRIAALFNGVAKVVAAKAALDQKDDSNA